jgi:hypothetical protein
MKLIAILVIPLLAENEEMVAVITIDDINNGRTTRIILVLILKISPLGLNTDRRVKVLQ